MQPKQKRNKADEDNTAKDVACPFVLLGGLHERNEDNDCYGRCDDDVLRLLVIGRAVSGLPARLIRVDPREAPAGLA